MRNLADPETDLDGFFERARRRRAHRRAGVRAEGRAVHRRWPTRSRRSAATSRRSRRRSPSRRRRCDVGIESFRVQRPFLADLDRASARTSRGATAELRGALPTLNRAVEVGMPVQRARARRSTRSCGKTLDQLRELAEAPGTQPGVRGLDRDRHHAQPAAALLRPVRDGLQLLRTTSSRTSPSTSPSRTRPAPPSARCSTRPARRTTALGSMGADEPANGEGVTEGTPQYAQDQPYGAGDHAGRARRLRDRPARLRSSATRAASRRQVQIEPRPAHARRAGPDLRRPRRACPRARRSPPSRRPARTRRPAESERSAHEAAKRSSLNNVGSRSRSPRSSSLRLPRLHQVDPVPAALRDQGGVRDLEQPQARARRCGSPASRSARSRSVERAEPGGERRDGDDADRGRGPPDPRRRDAPRSARASSSRATSSST